ncbi:hypothetical protein [Streptomyces sp. NPDC004296]|uniref:hypothetical protein n=1 Tax=Streptomyces sp. NPDC004296 TaxID=3364697 RepID=UPI0036D06058
MAAGLGQLADGLAALFDAHEAVAGRATELQRQAEGERCKAEGQLHPDADPAAAAPVLFALMPGLIINHHQITDITLKELTAGLTALGTTLTSME